MKAYINTSSLYPKLKIVKVIRAPLENKDYWLPEFAYYTVEPIFPPDTLWSYPVPKDIIETAFLNCFKEVEITPELKQLATPETMELFYELLKQQ